MIILTEKCKGGGQEQVPRASLGGQGVKLREGSSEVPEVSLLSSSLPDFKEHEANTAVPVCNDYGKGESGNEKHNSGEARSSRGTARVTERQKKADG